MLKKPSPPLLLDNYFKITKHTAPEPYKHRFDFHKWRDPKHYDFVAYRHKWACSLGFNFGRRRFVLFIYPAGQRSLRYYFNSRHVERNPNKYFHEV